MNTRRQRHTRRLAGSPTAGASIVVVIALFTAGCSGDNPADSSPAITLDDSFDGDAFDAACELLDAFPSSSPNEAVENALSVLTELGGGQAADNTLRLAVKDRCPEWQEPLDAVLADQP